MSGSLGAPTLEAATPAPPSVTVNPDDQARLGVVTRKLVAARHGAESDASAGLMIPREAVIRYRGLDWAYVRAGPSTFERRLIDNPVAATDGFFVAHGFACGDEVVVAGATALFAVEQSPPIKTR